MSAFGWGPRHEAGAPNHPGGGGTRLDGRRYPGGHRGRPPGGRPEVAVWRTARDPRPPASARAKGDDPGGPSPPEPGRELPPAAAAVGVLSGPTPLTTAGPACPELPIPDAGPPPVGTWYGGGPFEPPLVTELAARAGVF